MSRASRFHAVLRGRAAVPVLLVAACLFISGCDDDEVFGVPGFFEFSFSLAADFQGPHGGQPIEWALIRTADMVELARGDGTVSATTNPAFTADVGRVFEEGVDYEFRYWIDSNTNGGTLGVCDAETIDHQWNWRTVAPGNDVNFTLLYDANRVEYVCDTFTP